MKIKTILFDFGGVIIKTPNLDWVQRWRDFLGFKRDQELAVMLSNPMESEFMRDMFLGKKPEEDVWQFFTERWNLSPWIINRFRHYVFSKSRLNRVFVQFIKELNREYTTAILSNAGDQTRKIMEERYFLHEIVDEIIISAEEGLIKPDLAIYQLAVDRLDASPDTTLFIDDLPENVLAAKEFGMKAVQFHNTKQTIRAIRDYLEED